MKASFSFGTASILTLTMLVVGACAPQKADDAEKPKEVQTVPLSTDTGPYIARVFQQRIQTEAETFANPTVASSMGLFGSNCVTTKEDSTDTDGDGIPMIRVSQIDCTQGTVTTKGKVTLKDFDDNDANGGFDLLIDNLVVTNQDPNNLDRAPSVEQLALRL